MSVISPSEYADQRHSPSEAIDKPLREGGGPTPSVDFDSSYRQHGPMSEEKQKGGLSERTNADQPFGASRYPWDLVNC